MKKKLLTLSFFGISVGLLAQPTLTSQNNQIQPGTQCPFSTISPYSGSYGTTGPSQTWDFSTLTGGSSSISKILSCSVAPDCGTFTGANSAGDNGTGNISYFHIDNGQTATVGVASGSTNIVYTDPEIILKYPFTYNDTYSDNFSTTSTISGMTFERNGSVTVLADGYGTLITPTGTYNNVLRIYMHETYTLTNTSTSTQFGQYDTKQYYWYLPGAHFMLLGITHITGTQQGNPIDQAMIQYNTNASVGISVNSLSNSILTYPNPAQNKLHVQLENKNVVLEEITLTNMLGAIVRNKKMDGTQENFTLDVSQIKMGIYFVTIQTSKGIITKKIQIK